jgi:hypothetical protein
MCSLLLEKFVKEKNEESDEKNELFAPDTPFKNLEFRR